MQSTFGVSQPEVQTGDIIDFTKSVISSKKKTNKLPASPDKEVNLYPLVHTKWTLQQQGQ